MKYLFFMLMASLFQSADAATLNKNSTEHYFLGIKASGIRSVEDFAKSLENLTFSYSSDDGCRVEASVWFLNRELSPTNMPDHTLEPTAMIVGMNVTSSYTGVSSCKPVAGKCIPQPEIQFCANEASQRKSMDEAIRQRWLSRPELDVARDLFKPQPTPGVRVGN